jgi:putative ABC exporter
MKALSYLYFTTIKNSIKELRKNPGKLIAIIFFIAMLALVIFSRSLDSDLPSDNLRNTNELYAIVFALYSYLFIATSLKGLSSGASFYSMADVSLLFSTPISTKRILIYGLIKQMGTSLLVGVFLIYQYAWLNMTYGLSFGGLIVILIGYCIVVFCSQLAAMAIYSFSSNDEKLQAKIKFIIVGLSALVVSYIFYKTVTGTENIIDSAVEATNSFWLNLLPVVGWVKMAVVGVFSANYIHIISGVGLTLLSIFVIVYAITKIRSDFYEDVLLATEVSHSAITAKKEGNITDARKNVRVGRIGINRGTGADVFFYKHLIENRRSGLFLIDKTSIIFIIISIVYAFFTSNVINQNSENILPIFIFSTYMQIFSTATGRWIRELKMPFVYMIPVNPFLKLIKISKENILKITTEAIILFISIGILLDISPINIAVCIVARIGFGILFMSGNILTERLLGSLNSKVIIMFLYIIIMMILALPGIIIAIFTATSINMLDPIIAGLLITFIWNILISAFVIFLCRDILNYAELNNR